MKFITKKALSRRTVLRGVGATVALPLLDAMVPAAVASSATAARPVRRLGFVFMPMGADITRWTPQGDTLDDLSPILRSLAPVKDKVNALSQLELRPAYPGSHATSNSAFLSAARAKLTESSDYYLGTTVDQIAAREIGQETQLPSLELAMDMMETVGSATTDTPASTRTTFRGLHRPPRSPPRPTRGSSSRVSSERAAARSNAGGP